MRLLVATLRKLARRPATWVTFALILALLALMYFALIVAGRTSQDVSTALGARVLVTFPGAYEIILALVLGVGGFLAVAYGAAVAGSEWGWGTLKAAIARGESRSRYQLLTFAGVVLATWIGLLLVFGIGVLGSVVGALVLNQPLAGIADPEGLGRLPEAFARAGLSLAMHVAFGYAVATLARSQLAGIAVGIGLYFAEGISGFFLPDVIKWLPFSASSAVTSGGGAATVGSGPGSVTIAALDPGTAVLVTLGWLAVALALTALATERAEIGG